MKECGFIPNFNVSKEKAIEIIYNMQSKLNRPLMYDDFRNPASDEIGIETIKKYWGTMNKMKKELGLEIIQDNMMDKSRSIEEMKQDIIKLCNYICINENRNIILYDDIDNSDFCLSSQTYNKKFKENNSTLRKFIESLGFKLQKSGRGLNHTFKDGEKTKSQYELIFSNYLRGMNLKYNKDYFRDVRYKTFIKDYNGMLDCDYKIYLNNKIIYIEIAGMLRDYKKWYENNRVINSSKTRENYRKKLIKKEKMLKQNNLIYYILFPSDLNKKNLDGIFNTHVGLNDIRDKFDKFHNSII